MGCVWKTFSFKTGELISNLIAESKDYVEKEVADFYRSGKKLDCCYGRITRSAGFSKSYRLRGRLSTRCILGTVYDGYIGKKIDYYENCVDKKSIYTYISFSNIRCAVFPSKKDIVPVIEDCNARLRDTGIVLGINHPSVFIREGRTDYFEITIYADLGIL